ncbi:uncharacterized protein LOC143228893 [Tachypleus tridentatus]|uniref:uncharacterized protein LOC143228893 n=1 Tax=Tachypleus tridentatus TaxID=6853 RepID=UPI003FD3DAD2
MMLKLLLALMLVSSIPLLAVSVQAVFELYLTNKSLEEEPLFSTMAGSSIQCSVYCLTNHSCRAFGYHKARNEEAKPNCELRPRISTLTSNTVERKEWKIYRLKENVTKVYWVLDTAFQNYNIFPSPHETWKVDCNKENIETLNGVISGIWSNDTNFPLIKVKCVRWRKDSILNTTKATVINFENEIEEDCPYNNVLTAVADNQKNYDDVSEGKCLPLTSGLFLNYNKCVTILTTDQHGGHNDVTTPWKIQCPTEILSVAISIYRKNKIIRKFKCCEVISPAH